MLGCGLVPTLEKYVFMSIHTHANAPWQSGLRGARANLVPGLVLQVAALLLVFGYFAVPAMHEALARLAAFRQQTGFGFAVLSTGISGGLLPFLYLRHATGNPLARCDHPWKQGAILTLFWAYKGFEVDLLYRLQALMFGTGHDVATIVIKVVVDEFVYCPILAVPVVALIYQVADPRGGWETMRADIRAPHWYWRRALPVLISNIGVWVPAVAIIYTLPTPLQLPLQNIILCFYTLIVAHQTRSASA